MTRFNPPAPPYVGPPENHSGYDNKRPGKHPIDRIVMHGTVSATEAGGARNIARLFTEGLVEGSCHYVVDPAEAVQAAYDSVVCWHAPPNPGSLGVELCDWVGAPPHRRTPLPLSRWNDKPHRAMLANAARLVAPLCLAYNVPPKMRGPVALKAGRRGLCEHDDVSRAFGQSSHWDLGAFPRRRFARMVRAEIDAIRTPAKPKRKPTRVDRARDLLDAALDTAHARRQARRVRKLEAAKAALPTH